MNALVKIEEMVGRPISKLDLENIIYAGLFREDKNLSPEKAGELIDEFSDINIVAEKLGEVMTEDFGTKNVKRAAVKAEKTGTGTGS